MSGTVGIVHLDGAPVDRSLLERMTASMAFRGPDGRDTWVSESVGLGHARLRTTAVDAVDRQPCGVEDVWVVADCRLDGRAEVEAQLQPRHRQPAADWSDAELIAHAYLQWGTACVGHLLGDFAFAIWDAPRRRLFCARDHLGVKPLYYAHLGDTFLFSNTLDCLRQHPRVSDRLDDGAIGDFLLFERSLEASATAFADLRRLPAAHTLTLSAAVVKVERYWSVPIEGRIRFRDEREYTEQFAHLLGLAVGDRLGSAAAGMLMSGGVDSTSVATVAQMRHRSNATPALRGYTFVYDRLMPDEERHYAGLASGAIGMPIEFWPVDDYALFERCDDDGCRKPEPHHWPLEAATLDLYRYIAGSHRVALTGHGGDPLSYFGSLFCTPRWHALLPQAAAYMFSRRRLPPIGLRTSVRRLLGARPQAVAYPGWLNGAFAARMDLRGRLEQFNTEPAAVHPTHARAHALLSSSFWAAMFEGLDPGATRIPLEFRHPLFDVRLLEFVLAIPLMPWSVDKELLRSVTAGVQPDAVRRRPKSPLPGDPVLAHLRNGRPPELDSSTPAARLAEYVDLDAMQRAVAGVREGRWWNDLRTVSLKLWLQHV